MPFYHNTADVDVIFISKIRFISKKLSENNIIIFF